MKPAPEDLAARYAALSEVELMQIAQDYDSLTDAAQSALRAEFARRHLEPPMIGELAEPSDPEVRQLVTIRRYRDLAEAQIARSLLESNGIKSWIQDENLVRVDWMYSNAVGGIRLQAAREDEPLAEEVLSGQVPPVIAFDEKSEFVQPTCPTCGSHDISSTGSLLNASFVSPSLESGTIPSDGDTWCCNACGGNWYETNQPSHSQS
jgi:hypothetical protein